MLISTRITAVICMVITIVACKNASKNLEAKSSAAKFGGSCLESSSGSVAQNPDRCDEYYGDTKAISPFQQACQLPLGTWQTSRCPTLGMSFGCESIAGNGVTAIKWFYNMTVEQSLCGSAKFKTPDASGSGPTGGQNQVENQPSTGIKPSRQKYALTEITASNKYAGSCYSESASTKSCRDFFNVSTTAYNPSSECKAPDQWIQTPCSQKLSAAFGCSLGGIDNHTYFYVRWDSNTSQFQPQPCENYGESTISR